MERVKTVKTSGALNFMYDSFFTQQYKLRYGPKVSNESNNDAINRPEIQLIKFPTREYFRGGIFPVVTNLNVKYAIVIVHPFEHTTQQIAQNA